MKEKDKKEIAEIVAAILEASKKPKARTPVLMPLQEKNRIKFWKRAKKPMTRSEAAFKEFLSQNCGRGCYLCGKCEARVMDIIRRALKDGEEGLQPYMQLRKRHGMSTTT